MYLKPNINIHTKLTPSWPHRLHLTACILAMLTFLISCAQETSKPAQTPPTVATKSPAPIRQKVQGDSTYSNIRKADYVGPQVCAECHQENFKNWQQHPHSRMNMLATEETVLGDFSRATLNYGNKKAVFRKQDGQFLIEYFQEETLLRQFRITRVIGWRYEQDYVGFQTHGPEPSDAPIYQQELRVGFSYDID